MSLSLVVVFFPCQGRTWVLSYFCIPESQTNEVSTGEMPHGPELSGENCLRTYLQLHCLTSSPSWSFAPLQVMSVLTLTVPLTSCADVEGLRASICLLQLRTLQLSIELCPLCWRPPRTWDALWCLQAWTSVFHFYLSVSQFCCKPICLELP